MNGCNVFFSCKATTGYLLDLRKKNGFKAQFTLWWRGGWWIIAYQSIPEDRGHWKKHSPNGVDVEDRSHWKKQSPNGVDVGVTATDTKLHYC